MKWLISGISGGYGLAMAEYVLQNQGEVFGFSRNPQKMKWLENEYPNRVHLWSADLQNTEEVRKVVGEIFATAGELDVIYSNVGSAIVGESECLQEEEIRRIISLNLIDTICFLNECVSYLKRQKHGYLIQMSSFSARVAFANWSVYSASKHGISGFCECLQKEVEPYGIKVIIVEPGNTKTGLWKGFHASSDRDFVEYDVDITKAVQMIWESVQKQEVPLHLVLGEKAFQKIKRSLEIQLLELEKESMIAKYTSVTDDTLQVKVKQERQLLSPNTLNGRKIIFWGLGKEGKSAIKWHDWSLWDRDLKYFMEESMPEHKLCLGREIIHRDSDWINWSEYYIIIGTSQYYDSISEFLKEKKLREGQDYCYWGNLVNKGAYSNESTI